MMICPGFLEVKLGGGLWTLEFGQGIWSTMDMKRMV